MATSFTYTKIADFILDDLFGFASANAIKDNTRYIAEDILGDPASNSEVVDFTQAAVTVSGGKLTASHADGMDVTNDITVSGEMKGSRVTFNFGDGNALGAANLYLGTGHNSANIIGPPMNRPGSIVGASVHLRSTSYSSNTTYTPRIRKGGTNQFSLSAIAVTGVGQTFNVHTTVVRGTHTFVAGDQLTIYMELTLVGTIQHISVGMIEVVFDT